MNPGFSEWTWNDIPTTRELDRSTKLNLPKKLSSFATVQPLSKLHRLHRYSEMLIAIPAEGYLRSYR